MPETTENYHRIPTGSKKKKDAEIRTITISSKQGIKALYDVKNKVIITYLFSVKKWSMKDAKGWVKKNKSNATHLVVAENFYLSENIADVIYSDREKVLKETFRLMEEN